jgi:hypothetical protein
MALQEIEIAGSVGLGWNMNESAACSVDGEVDERYALMEVEVMVVSSFLSPLMLQLAAAMTNLYRLVLHVQTAAYCRSDYDEH